MRSLFRHGLLPLCWLVAAMLGCVRPSSHDNDAFIQGSGDPGPGTSPSDPGNTAPSDTATATIGPEGGELQLAGGVLFTVPPGALAASTTITATRITTAPSEVNAETFVDGVAFEPDGLIFDVPATLTFPVQKSDDLSAVTLPNVEAAPADTDGTAEVLPETFDFDVAPGGAAVRVEHFSKVVLLRDVNCAGATDGTEQLSRQIKDEWETLAKDAGLSAPLLPLAGPGITAPETSAFLSKLSLIDLQKAAAEAPLRVNFAWRSVATQWVIGNAKQHGSKGCQTSALVGNSPHGVGTAVDIDLGDLDLDRNAADALCLDEYPRVKAGGAYKKALSHDEHLALMNAVIPELGARMLRHNWVWLGLYAEGLTKKGIPLACTDSVHFDHRSSTDWTSPIEDTAKLKSLQVKAYQRLWNEAFPCDAITESGVFAPVDGPTATRLAKTPVAGLPEAELPVEGGGCLLPAQVTCCAGNAATKEKPFCAGPNESCGCGERGERCCTSKTPPSQPCTGGLLCTAGTCGGCGGPGEPCCGGTTCTEANTTCTAGRCTVCGIEGTACCTTGTACTQDPTWPAWRTAACFAGVCREVSSMNARFECCSCGISEEYLVSIDAPCTADADCYDPCGGPAGTPAVCLNGRCRGIGLPRGNDYECNGTADVACVVADPRCEGTGGSFGYISYPCVNGVTQDCGRPGLPCCSNTNAGYPCQNSSCVAGRCTTVGLPGDSCNDGKCDVTYYAATCVTGRCQTTSAVPSGDGDAGAK